MIKLMKKSIALFVILALSITASGIVSFAATPRSDPDMCFVDTDGGNLNCRSGAGEEYALRGKFANGTQVFYSLMTGDKEDSLGRTWMNVSGKSTTGSKIEGWVLLEYLRFESPYKSAYAIPIINKFAPDIG